MEVLMNPGKFAKDWLENLDKYLCVIREREVWRWRSGQGRYQQRGVYTSNWTLVLCSLCPYILAKTTQWYLCTHCVPPE